MVRFIKEYLRYKSEDLVFKLILRLFKVFGFIFCSLAVCFHEDFAVIIFLWVALAFVLLYMIAFIVDILYCLMEPAKILFLYFSQHLVLPFVRNCVISKVLVPFCSFVSKVFNKRHFESFLDKL